MEIQALFFDFDGVIADTETVWIGCIVDYCAMHGAPVTQEELQRYLGDGDVMMLEYVSKCCGTPKEEILAALRVSFADRTRKLGLRPGVRHYLDFARSNGLRLAIVSNSTNDYIHRWLKQLDIEGRFDLIVTRDGHLPAKPAPDMYRWAAQQLQIPPEHAIAIEDSPIGLRSALDAGFRVVAYPNPSSPETVASLAPLVVDLGRVPPEKMIECVVEKRAVDTMDVDGETVVRMGNWTAL